MIDLVKLAMALIKYDASDRIQSQVISAAKDLLCLAETETRMGLQTMSRRAETHEDDEVLPTPTVPEMFIQLRNTDRDCQEILRTIEMITSRQPIETDSESMQQIGSAAVERLATLANFADRTGEHHFAGQIDELLTAILAE